MSKRQPKFVVKVCPDHVDGWFLRYYRDGTEVIGDDLPLTKAVFVSVARVIARAIKGKVVVTSRRGGYRDTFDNDPRRRPG